MTEVASAMPKPPDPIVIDDLRVVAMRPPVTPDGPWWWRGFWRDKEAKCSRAHTFGRGTRAAIRAAAMSFYNGPMHTKTPEPVVVLSTVRDLLRAFKAHQRARMESGQIEVNSFEAYDYAGKRLADPKRSPQIGDIGLEDVTDSVLEDYAGDRLKAKHGAKTINDDLAYFLMAWRWGGKRKYCPKTELAPNMLDPKPVRTKYTPSPGEVLAVIPRLKPRYRLMLRIQLLTGARPGEIASLEWADVDFDAEILHLGRHEGARKTGAREVEPPSALFDELRAWQARTPDAWGRRDGIADRWVLGVAPVSALSVLEKQLRIVCAEAGVPTFRPHSIRSTLEDDLAERQVDPKVYAGITGHTEEEALRTYRKTTSAARRKVLRASSAARLMYGEEKVIEVDFSAKKD